MRLSLFECDACGDRHGHLNEMHEFGARFPSGEYENPRHETLHVCLDCGPAGLGGLLASINHVRVALPEFEEAVEDESRGRWEIVSVVLTDGQELPREKADEFEGAATGEANGLAYLEDEVL